MMNGLFQLIRIEEFIQHKWVMQKICCILLYQDHHTLPCNLHVMLKNAIAQKCFEMRLQYFVLPNADQSNIYKGFCAMILAVLINLPQTEYSKILY